MNQETETDKQPVDAKALRRCLGHFATGVAVVTTRHDGADCGITINSFTSVSLDPPLVLWCLARSSRSLPAFVSSDHFIVNVLATDQVAVSNRFAFREGAGFPTDVPFSRALAEIPILDGACARFQCRKSEMIDGGDHVAILGEIVEFDGSDRPGLVYHRGQYAIADFHPAAVDRSQDRPPGSFLDSTVRPGLEQITRRFEAYFDHELRDAGISSKESRVIGLLLSNGPLDAEQIANLSLVSGASLNETLESLAGKQLITKSQAIYELTGDGHSLASGLSEKLRSYRANTLGNIAPEEAEELQRMLSQLNEWIRSASSGQRP
jgi:flavin reductase (DIM6/NTAB) family NADH-FMN oxidoreductase RutF/DNA-binding MarR family transcriptional regulator